MGGDTDGDEGMDFKAVFNSQFGSPARTEERLKAEQRAAMTPKQRARKKATRTEQVNFRCTPETRAQLERLAKALDQSMAEVITTAIARMADGSAAGDHR